MDDYSGQGRRRVARDDCPDGGYGYGSRYDGGYDDGYGSRYDGGYDAARLGADRSPDRSRQEPAARSRAGQVQRRTASSGYRTTARAGGTARTGGRAAAGRAGYSARSASGASRQPARQGGMRPYPVSSRGSSGGYGSYGGYGGYGGGNRGFFDGPWPKRIIAAVVAVILVVLLVNLVTCVAHGVSGSQGSAASSAASQSSGASPDSAASASQSAAAALPGPGEGVEDTWVEGGRFTTGDAELDQMVKAFCDENSSPELSAADNAFNAYCAVVWGEYIEIDENQEPLGTGWDIEYAKRYITEGGGNCYNYAAFNEFVLKYFGYSDATAEPCIVLRQSGDYGDHGLVFVTNIEDGRRCLCDSAYGANGWMMDIDSYTMQVRDIGQDPSEFTVAPFEGISVAPWYDAASA